MPLKNSLSKAEQLGYRGKKDAQSAYKGSEAALQSFADQYLTLMRIFNVRIPDGFWKWLGILPQKWYRYVKWFRGTFSAWADNTCLIKISNRYSLCMSLELKTAKGQLHGKQVQRANQLAWVISRGPEDVQREVQQYQMDAQMLSEILETCEIHELYEAHVAKRMPLPPQNNK